jgi:hypothetical protein
MLSYDILKLQKNNIIHHQEVSMIHNKNIIILSLFVPIFVFASDPSEQPAEPPSYDQMLALERQSSHQDASPRAFEAARPARIAQAPAGPVRGRDYRTNIEKCMALPSIENKGGSICATALGGGSIATCFPFFNKRINASGNPVLAVLAAESLILCTCVTCCALGAFMGNCSGVIEEFGSDALLARQVQPAGRDQPLSKQAATLAHYHADQYTGRACRAYSGCLEGIADITRKPRHESARLIIRLLDRIRPDQEHGD